MTSKKTTATPVVQRKDIGRDTVIPVVEKKDAKCCSCGDNCTCEKTCNCEMFETALKCGTILISSLIIAAAITWKPCPMGGKMPRHDRVSPIAATLDEKGLKDYIMKNPKVLIDSVDAYYKAQEAKAAPAPKVAPADLVNKIVNDKTNYSLGNPKGKFVIIEFFDYNCGWCKKTNKELGEALKRKEASNIRWIPIDTPIFGENSETIARYVLAAGKQGKYAEMHDAVGEATAKGKLDEAGLIELGKTLKLDTKKLTADANGAEIKAKMEANREYTKALNIGGVPMLIVDGNINPGALLGDKLEEAVKASQAKK